MRNFLLGVVFCVGLFFAVQQANTWLAHHPQRGGIVFPPAEEEPVVAPEKEMPPPPAAPAAVSTPAASVAAAAPQQKRAGAFACPDCKGTGRALVVCSACAGSGYMHKAKCQKCKGTGWTKCPHCDGAGGHNEQLQGYYTGNPRFQWIPCDSCAVVGYDGAPKKPGYIPCAACGQQGYVMTEGYSPSEPNEMCRVCNGKGKVKSDEACPRCGGTGRVNSLLR